MSFLLSRTSSNLGDEKDLEVTRLREWSDEKDLEVTHLREWSDDNDLPQSTRTTPYKDLKNNDTHKQAIKNRKDDEQLKTLLQKLQALQREENDKLKMEFDEKIVLLTKKTKQQDKETEALRYKTQKVGQWDVAERNKFFVKMYSSFLFQFLSTIVLVFLWINIYPLKTIFRENPIPLSAAIFSGMIISFFFLCGFRKWVFLSLISLNLTFSMLVGIGVLYADSTFLIECMGGVSVFSGFLIVLNIQKRFAYSTGVLICLIFLLFLMTVWHFIYLPYHSEFSSLNSIFDSTGVKVERLIALVSTVFLCCGYMLYFEQIVKTEYLIEEHVQASIHLYLHILFFIYLIFQLLHLWSVRCRRCRRGADGYISA